MHYKQVKYYLINPILGRIQLRFQPIGWDEDKKKLVRNEESWGVFTELSNDLKFVKDGKELIRQVYETQGTEAELILERYVKISTEIGYQLDYKGFLDLKTYQINDEKVSIQFLTGGLQNLIESQFDEDYELERGTDINGNQITTIQHDIIYWTGRRIFLESLADNSNSSFYQLDLRDFYGLGGNYAAFVNFRPALQYTSDENFLIPSSNFGFTYLQPNPITQYQGSISNFFFWSQSIRTINVDFEWSFKIQSYFRNGISNSGVIIGYTIFEYDTINGLGSVVQTITIEQLSGGSTGITTPQIVNQTYSGNTNVDIDLQPNQVVGFGLIGQAVGIAGQNSGGSGFFQIITSETKALIKVNENSTFEPTEFKGLKLYNAFDRMLEILTGKQNKVVSDYLQNGEFANTLITSGKHIRNLPDAKITIQLKDLYETNNYLNLGWAVENHKGIEKFVVEQKNYFFQNRWVIDLGEVSDLTIKCKAEKLYKSMTFGNRKAGDYEEIQGLQEYNALTTYVSHLKTADNKYEVDANVRADLVGAELARRKNYSVAPNEDTRYDNENFLFDCKPYETTKFTPRLWQDVLGEEPFLYDPESAGNLLFTPFRSMQRHSKVFNAGLKLYQDKFTRYSKGTGKVDVITKLANKPARPENSDIENSELNQPYFEAIEYEFTKPLTTDIRQKLKGMTSVNGRNIPNVNFLIKFAYKGQAYTGYILEVFFNDPGQWKLIKNYN